MKLSRTTDPLNAESYDTALVKGLWQFDSDSAVNSLSPDYNLTTTRGAATYAASTQFYAGNRVARIRTTLVQAIKYRRILPLVASQR